MCSHHFPRLLGVLRQSAPLHSEHGTSPWSPNFWYMSDLRKINDFEVRSPEVEYLTFEGHFLFPVRFHSNYDSLLLIVILNKRVKFQHDRISRLGVNANGISRKLPISYNGDANAAIRF